MTDMDMFEQSVRNSIKITDQNQWWTAKNRIDTPSYLRDSTGEEVFSFGGILYLDTAFLTRYTIGTINGTGLRDFVMCFII